MGRMLVWLVFLKLRLRLTIWGGFNLVCLKGGVLPLTLLFIKEGELFWHALVGKSLSDAVKIKLTDSVLIRIGWARSISNIFTNTVQNWISKLFIDLVLR